MVQKTIHNSFNQRSSLLTAFLVVIFVVVGIRLFSLQIIHGQDFRTQADAQHSIYQKLFPSRGEIKLADPLSPSPVVVATNLKSYLVYAVPQDIINSQLTAESLAGVLQMEAKDILQKITASGKKYVPIKKRLTDQEQQRIKDLKLSGIFFDSEDTRFYPENNLLSQTLGFVGYKGSAKQGLYGLEKYFDSDLTGKPGELVGEKDTSGAWIYGSNKQERPAVDGVDLILTVDKTIQFNAESIIKDTVIKNGADSGSVIVADPKTGAILAMANYPDFNPNEYNKVDNQGNFNNLATVGSYEPGSTFKAMTMAAALDAGKITPDTTYTDTGFVKVDNYIIKNAEPGARGVQTMTQALDFSLNTGAIFVQNQLGNSDFLKYLKSFGFGKKTGIELPENAGDLSGLKGNITVNYDTASFGQGISTTPIQMVQAYGALANGGKMMKPYIVQSKIYPDGKAVNTEPMEVGQVVSSKAAAMISAMLVDVVENGFGKKAAVPGYFLAGKTGTAQVPNKNGKPGYEANINIGSFIGYGPVENPRFVILIRVDHPRDVQFAESTAGPAWRQMAQFVLNYMHIQPNRNIGK